MEEIADESIPLIVTSPPYPMIGMWDELFVTQNPAISTALEKNMGMEAFEGMHQELDSVWREAYRVLQPGGIAAINIGDATRTLGKTFRLYSNHSRIIQAMEDLSMSILPSILWRKPTNSPNKFMGSGMLSPGAYVTLEHEFILLFRKGGKRNFTLEEDKQRRRESAYFWEERNQWFSDLWEFTGTRQSTRKSAGRERSAAYPLELPWRLIQMFSVIGDVVLDPFLGTGTTTRAALLSGRSSIGYELDPGLTEELFTGDLNSWKGEQNDWIKNRLQNHEKFVAHRKETKGPNAFKHHHEAWDIPVMTSQEKEINWPALKSVECMAQEIHCQFSW
ncbi:site-specific DNA-methyltransferase [bacterium SCSIO 12741]|nr:site-specific DNA-methyltransferase [bacterium SCSIO 12741]